MRNRSPNLSRRLMLRALLGAAALPAPLAAMAGFNFFTSEYTASREELERQIAKHFPVQKRYADIFTVSLSNPQLRLDSVNNRAAITAALTINSPLLRPSTVQGVVSVSSALKYDAPARALRLDQPQAERLELQGVTGHDAERLQQIGALVAQELLRDQPLRTFTAEELTVGRKTYEIGAITVQNDGITVELK
ncbi:DUF1439 domain-containing protein [Variovorax sp. Sphag1AA]|uniref:DUF1439 domain-containing protein n=1 Tax=Variovorax sp. Sphag1AA TaxID=2587027 RepID=UPI00161EAD68|nr:DUF1439 domain-containing protein [Variovorax sp. Sphag1AA]MBB3178981.1 hypothetical protein [Variovorax sp. Sphag1AA]